MLLNCSNLCEWPLQWHQFYGSRSILFRKTSEKTIMGVSYVLTNWNNWVQTQYLIQKCIKTKQRSSSKWMIMEFFYICSCIFKPTGLEQWRSACWIYTALWICELQNDLIHCEKFQRVTTYDYFIWNNRSWSDTFAPSHFAMISLPILSSHEVKEWDF